MDDQIVRRYRFIKNAPGVILNGRKESLGDMPQQGEVVERSDPNDIWFFEGLIEDGYCEEITGV